MFLAQWFARRQASDISSRASSDQQERLALASHVEAATLLRRVLLSPGPDLETLAPLTADSLIGAGLDALTRKDLPTATGLLERGRDLLPSGDPRHLSLALRICDAGVGLWDQPRCLTALRSALAALPGEATAKRTCDIQQCIVQLRLERATPAAIAARAKGIEAGLSHHLEDDLAWCRYHQLAAYLHLQAERETAAEKSLRLALKRARSMADRYEEERLLCALCEVTRSTPTPVSTGLELCASLAGRLAADRALLVPILVTRAYLNALTGNVTDARADLAVAARHADDLRLSLAAAAIMETSGLVESMAGAHAAAERSYRRGAAMLRAAGQVRDAQSLEAAAARAMLDQHRPAGAELAALQAERAPMAPRVRLTVTVLRARLASAEGRHDRAVRLARRAWPGALDTDDPYLAAEVLLDVSLVLAAAGRTDQAAPAAAHALARLQAKGATLPEARARDVLRSLPVSTA